MAIAFCFSPSSSSSFSSISKLDPHRPLISSSSSSSSLHLRLASTTTTSLTYNRRNRTPYFVAASSGGGGFNGRGSSGGGGGGGGGDDDGHGHGGEPENAGGKNRAEAILVLKEAGRSLESLPKDLAAAIESGRIPGLVVSRYFELEKSGLIRWLMQFGGFKERLLADDLFLAKVAMECGVGMLTKVLSPLLFLKLLTLSSGL